MAASAAGTRGPQKPFATFSLNLAALVSQTASPLLSCEQQVRLRAAWTLVWISDGAAANESAWQVALGYVASEWESVRERFAAVLVRPDGSWALPFMADEAARQDATTQRQRSCAGMRWHANASSTMPLDASGSGSGSKTENLHLRSPAPPDERVPSPNGHGTHARTAAPLPSAAVLPLPLPIEPSDSRLVAGGRPERPAAFRQSKAQTAREWEAEFHEAFWQRYPRKVGKGAALRVWMRLPPTQENLDAILTGLARWKSAHADDELQYIPHPATWLSQRRWEDQSE